MSENTTARRAPRTRQKEQTEAVQAEQETPQEEAKPKRAPRTRQKAAAAPTTEKDHSAESVNSAVAESLAQLEPKARKPRATKAKTVEIELDSIAEAAEPAKRTRTKKAQTDEKSATGEEKPARKPRKKATAAKSDTVTADQPKDSAAAATSPKDDAGSGENAQPIVPAMTALLFQEPDVSRVRTRKRPAKDEEADSAEETPAPRTRTRKTSSKKESAPAEAPAAEAAEETASAQEQTSTTEETEASEPRRRRRGSRGRRKGTEGAEEQTTEQSEGTSEAAEEAAPEEGIRRRRRRPRSSERSSESTADEVAAPKGSTRLEAKRQRRKEGREAGRRRHTISESEYLARRESVRREMLVREQDGLNQIAVLEDDVLVEHYVARHTQVSMVGNVYLGRVQNVLPSMEAAFVDIGKGRNAVLYAGEVNWEAAGMEGKPRRIEQALKSGDTVLVQVTKDPIGHKGARLTAQITLAGRHLVLVPSGAMTGISRKLPDRERQRLKRLLREIVPSEHGVIVRTAAEGASEEQLRADVERLTKTWDDIQTKSKNTKSAPTLLKGEPELAVRVVRDIFNEDFQALKVQGNGSWTTISEYVAELSPELSSRVLHWTDSEDIFAKHRVDEQLAKAFDRKVWLPSGGTLVIDRTEAMTVIDVNTGKFTGSGGTLEETVTRNNLEAAEEIVRQLRLRDIGGIIVVDFIDMVLEANRELVLRRLVECLGRDRTRHQVAEVTSLGLVQMTRKRVGQGLVEAFSTSCEACEGRGYITHTHPVERGDAPSEARRASKAKSAKKAAAPESAPEEGKQDEIKATLNSIAAAAASRHDEEAEPAPKRGRGRKTSAKKAAAPAQETPVAEAVVVEDSSASQAAAETEAHEAGAPAESAKGNKPARKRTTSTARKSTRKGDAGAEANEAPGAASEPAESEDAQTEPAAKPTRKRRVSSSGTITPGAGNSNSILSFPAK